MQNLLPVVPRQNLLVTHGKGAYFFDDKNNKYLDFISGVASNIFGYSDPELEGIACEQIKKINHVSVNFRTKELEDAAEKLINFSGIDGLVYFLNSGTEAVETAIKIARRHFYKEGLTHKNEIICFKNSFHGRTLGSLAAQGNEKYLEGFEPRIQGFVHADLNDIESIKSLISDKTAAIIIEPIQGEGGVITCDQEFVRKIRQICHDLEIILISDEVQCGLVRSGKKNCFEHFEITPDILINAKALGGGIAAIGSCIVSKKFAKHMTVGTHGSTFGGNAFACGLASYTLDRISNPEFIENTRKTGENLGMALNDIVNHSNGIITELRGLGMLRGIKINESIMTNFEFTELAKKTANLMLTISSKHNVIRILPRLNLTKDELDDFSFRMKKILSVI